MMNRFLKIALFMFIIPAISFAGQFKVIRVTDGDTIKVAGNGTEMTIRLVGIDAPETTKKKHEQGNHSVRNQLNTLQAWSWINQLI